MANQSNPVDDEGGIKFRAPPPVRSRCTIGGPNGIKIVSPAVAPNRFWRMMQRWCLGIVWEILDDDNQPIGN